MKPLNREQSILMHIVEYCDQIAQTKEFFGDDYGVFAENAIYRNAAAMCILQIGELVSILPDEFKERHSDIPWRQIKSMRNIVAHRYGTIDPDVAWETITEDVPVLKEKCCAILKGAEVL